MENPFAQQRAIDGIKNVVAVASGKGGVGKSTIAANLAVAYAKSGLKVGLLDCDIYGPSVPRLFGAINQKPSVNEQGKIQPHVRAGVKLMSIGFLIDENAAVVWRGPMLFKAIDQFLRDVEWGDLDVLVVDLPPGTGDVQLTLAQKVPLTGALMVCTPQNLALIDVKKAVDMFRRINIPILGVVENMAYVVDEATGNKIELFPRGELDQYTDANKFTKIAQLPFYPKVAKHSEMGLPITESSPQSDEAKAFFEIAQKTRAQLM